MKHEGREKRPYAQNITSEGTCLPVPHPNKAHATIYTLDFSKVPSDAKFT